MELTSKLEGFEDYTLSYKWACDQGEGFHFVEDINAVSCIFTAAEENPCLELAADCHLPRHQTKRISPGAYATGIGRYSTFPS